MAYPASLVSFFPFTEGTGSPVDVIRSFAGTLQGGATWGSNAFGTCVSCPDSSSAADLGTEGTNLTLPTGDITMLVIRRLRDTILDTNGYLVRGGSSDAGGDAVTIYVPFSDGTVYFDYGGNSGAHRITWAGYTPATTVERWAFSQGPAGGKIYLGGTLRATGTQGTRSAGSSVFHLNFNPGSGSVRQEFNHFALLSEQWPDATVAAWSAAGDPADFLATGAGGGGGGGGGFSTFFSSPPDVAADLSFVGGARGAMYVTRGVFSFSSVATPAPTPTYPLLTRIESGAWRGSWRGSSRGDR